MHFNIASCYHSLSSNLGHTCSALEHAQRALDLSEGDGAIEWLVQQLVRQKDAEEKKLEKEKYFLSMGNEAPSLSMPEPVQVDIYGIMKDAYTLAFVFQISSNHCSWCDLAPISIHTCIYLIVVCVVLQLDVELCMRISVSDLKDLAYRMLSGFLILRRTAFHGLCF